MKVLVTGATGYIGERLIKKIHEGSHEPIAASRRQAHRKFAWLHFDLTSPEKLILPKDVKVIIHLAVDTSYENESSELEVIAAQTLLSKAQAIGAKFLFVSSQTAHPNAPTSYGQTKFRIEQEVLQANGLVVRPGQVYGGKICGLFGSIVNIVRKSPILPAFLPSPLIQPIHVDELVEGLLKLAESHDIHTGLFCLAAPQPVSFTYFLKVIALYRVRKKRYFIIIPTALIRFLIILFENILHINLSLARLNSLFSLPPMNTANDLKILNLRLRPLHSGMCPSGHSRQRRLIREASTLLTYLLKERPSSTLIRRYVHMIITLRSGLPLDLPTFTYCWPVTLAIIDTPSYISFSFGKELAWRVNAASMIAEATQQGSVRFLGNRGSSGKLSPIFKILFVFIFQSIWFLIGLICKPIFYIWLKKRRNS